jgi:hypothetical protein
VQKKHVSMHKKQSRMSAKSSDSAAYTIKIITYGNRHKDI